MLSNSPGVSDQGSWDPSPSVSINPLQWVTGVCGWIRRPPWWGISAQGCLTPAPSAFSPFEFLFEIPPLRRDSAEFLSVPLAPLAQPSKAASCALNFSLYCWKLASCSVQGIKWKDQWHVGMRLCCCHSPVLEPGYKTADNWFQLMPKGGEGGVTS